MSTSQIISIENCTAAQILTSRDVPLASGTLRLVENQAPEAGLTSTIMTLEIGRATFPLTKYTAFFTHVTSSRIYIFSPTLEDVSLGAGTYVKITLPQDVQVEGSEAEQARKSFEGALVKHGLLQGGPVAVANETLHSTRDAFGSISSGVQDSATTTISAIRNGVAFVHQQDTGIKAVELPNRSGEAGINTSKPTGDAMMSTPTVTAAGNVSAGDKEGLGGATETHGPVGSERGAVGRREVGVEHPRH
ncbi:hypothetical protein BDV93DRAFT_546845 [Ceratobasidium sp. AG-I]|nr:hypothetical protein BDV93DRAFT_546845 [Ceratobasidium sp. AG-I]